MSDRDALLRRLAGRGGPDDPALQQAWRKLSDTDRDRLRWTATDPTAAAHLDDQLARDLVGALAADRAARRQRDVAVPVLTALLVLSTVWGFGRAALPELAGWSLLLGLVGALLTVVVGWRRRAGARGRAREVRRVLRG